MEYQGRSDKQLGNMFKGSGLVVLAIVAAGIALISIFIQWILGL